MRNNAVFIDSKAGNTIFIIFNVLKTEIIIADRIYILLKLTSKLNEYKTIYSFFCLTTN